jgi:hypothetical protein
MALNRNGPPRQGQIIGDALKKKGDDWPQMRGFLYKLLNNTRANDGSDLRNKYERERESIHEEVDDIFINRMGDLRIMETLCIDIKDVEGDSFYFPGMTK